MLRRIGDFYALIFGRPFFIKINRGLFYLSCRGLGLLNYTSGKISGEEYAQKKFIPKTGTATIFDVGANKGAWAEEVLKRNPQVELHVFEPSILHRKILTNLKGNVTVNSVAVGNTIGDMMLYDYENNIGSEHASLLDGVIDKIHNNKSVAHCVPIITLDTYCDEKGISSIDFLKIDTEGFEYQVLMGGREILKATKILQFEFNEMNIVGRVFFSDFFNLLGENFTIYRMLPSGLIEIKNYSPWHCEQFTFQNFLAVNKNA